MPRAFVSIVLVPVVGLVLGLAAGVGTSGCAPEDAAAPAAGRAFRFDSGGAHHIEGFGAWRVEVTDGGRFRVAHQVRAETTAYPETVLSAEEARELWSAIDAADLAALTSSVRPGVPDEVRMAFVLERKGGPPIEVTLWADDVRRHPGLEPVLAGLRRLIASRHGVKPVF